MTENHIALTMDYKMPTPQPLAQLRTNRTNHNGIANGKIFNNIEDEVEILTPDDRVPKAVPEPTDDDNEDDEIDDFDDRPLSTDKRFGVDDGLLPPPSNDESDSNTPRPLSPRAKRPSITFDTGTGMVDINGVLTPLPDLNAYQHKKTLAQGMMDLALLSANANQLRYVLESYKRHPYYYPSIIFISISIIFQIAVGVGLILNSRYNVKDEKEICRANKVNNYTIIGIFIITVVNVFISAFGVAEPSGEN